jgi:hypothetical protein
MIPCSNIFMNPLDANVLYHSHLEHHELYTVHGEAPLMLR